MESTGKSSTGVGVGGINFCGLLAILFIGLKLTGYITWSWLWVLSPLWLPFAIFLAVVLVCGVCVLVCWALAWLIKQTT
jgi:hypothetical protein